MSLKTMYLNDVVRSTGSLILKIKFLYASNAASKKCFVKEFLSMEKLQNKKRPLNARRYNNPDDISMFQIAMTKYDQARVNVLARSSFLLYLRTKEAITCALLHYALNSIEQQMGRKILAEWNGHEIKIDLDTLLREKQTMRKE